ncbi:MAG: succinyl-diaminopimelate desuccinylase [Alphaproteobacteria bacterium]|nr:succinyl-diaminopimelate desuccinylase [Alphaproteobacteria bacterium]MCR4555210.1 succinyl-diaminopimelate desuccinylase [Alphaproteobacteria bacterium]
MDVVRFCSDLVRCKSVTPADDGAIDYISEFLKGLGFETKILKFSEGDRTVRNLFAKFEKGKGANLGFLGHSDVVPAGDGWDSDPFDPILLDGFLIGRGVADMKGGISAFCCAVEKFVREKSFSGSIRIFVTGDEEIGSYQGIRSLLNWAKGRGEIPNDCLVGEPSSDKEVGDRVYIGHRGSINVKAKSVGKQLHVACSQNETNSLAQICRYVAAMKDYEWKYEDRRFPKTNLEPTLLFTGNYAENIVPGESSANVNIRFGADYNSEQIKRILSEKAAPLGIELSFRVSGEAYCCDDERLKNLISAAIKNTTGLTPRFSTGGGTSDGRHMIKHCNVIEFGIQDRTMHQSNERVKIEDLRKLENIYFEFLRLYFNA